MTYGLMAEDTALLDTIFVRHDSHAVLKYSVHTVVFKFKIIQYIASYYSSLILQHIIRI